MSAGYDCVIIGGGHNGLICAAYLAKAGRRVVVLEGAARLGGAAITREFHPGFRVSAGAHILHMLPCVIADELALARHGFTSAAASMVTTALSPDGVHLNMDAGSSNLSPADTAAYVSFMSRMRRFAAHLRPLFDQCPPRLGTSNWADRIGLLRVAWQIRSLGRADMRELLRIIGMNIYDLAEEHFESPSLRGAVAFDAVLGTNYGPRAPGTVFTLLCRLAVEPGAIPMQHPAGGLGAVSDAIAGAARAAGAELRIGSRVKHITVENDRATGVVLQSGEIINAATVISSADPRTTFLQLLGTTHLDTGFVRRVTHFRSVGLTAKLHLALSAAPQFTGVDPAALRGRLIIAPTLDYLENAYNPSKYAACSDAPALEIIVPTCSDPTLAPQGQHVVSANVQYAPHKPKEGWAAARAPFLEHIIDTLETYAPTLRSQLLAAELLTPEGIEQEFGMCGGHWHHGELAFDQFFMVRPIPGATQYRTPLPGLHLCGAGSHPGGGVMGLAGRNAARQILREAS
jgi:phytoene dehydrogenase-like protein